MKKMLMMAAVCLMAAMTFAAQCAAKTKKSTQCKRQASPGSSYCWQHGGTTKAERASDTNNAEPVQTRRGPRKESAGAIAAPVSDGRCQATTMAGTQCKRKAQAGSKYCFQHAGSAAGVDAEAAPAPIRGRKARAAGEEASSKQPVAAESASGGTCAATTKDGSPCKRKAKPGSKFCWQHDK